MIRQNVCRSNWCAKILVVEIVSHIFFVSFLRECWFNSFLMRDQKMSHYFMPFLGWRRLHVAWVAIKNARHRIRPEASSTCGTRVIGIHEVQTADEAVGIFIWNEIFPWYNLQQGLQACLICRKFVKANCKLLFPAPTCSRVPSTSSPFTNRVKNKWSNRKRYLLEFSTLEDHRYVFPWKRKKMLVSTFWWCDFLLNAPDRVSSIQLIYTQIILTLWFQGFT